MDIILNKVAIWRPTGAKELHVKLSGRGERYLQANSPVILTAEKSLKRFSKDYEIAGVTFSLFVRTSGDVKDQVVERQLDQVATKITKEYALRTLADIDVNEFQYTSYSIEENE